MKRLSRPVYTPTNLNNTILHRLRDDDPSLVRIIFSSRNLGSAGCQVLANSLQNNTHLAALDLSHNSIGAGAQFIATLLQHQARKMHVGGRGGIRTLMLGDNNLRDDGVKALVEALARNGLIESLCLDDNHIGAVGLALIGQALLTNTSLKRLHLRHNSFQSLSPLIHCTFNRESLESVANSNHSLRHVFLNCGYSYECEELEMILRINRLGEVEARRKKIAVYLEEDLGRMLRIDVDGLGKALPRLLSILSQHGSTSVVLQALLNFPTEIFYFGGSNPLARCMDESMDADDSMDVEYLA